MGCDIPPGEAASSSAVTEGSDPLAKPVQDPGLAEEIESHRARMRGAAPLPLRDRAPLLEDLVARAEACAHLDPRDLAWARLLLADVREEQGRGDEGLQLVEWSREVSAGTDDLEVHLRGHLVAAEIELARDEHELAREQTEAGFALLGDRVDLPAIAVSLWNLRARVFSEQEDYLEAMVAYERALDLCDAHGFQGNAIRMLANVSALRQASGLLDAAIESCTRARDLCERPDVDVDGLTYATVLRNLAFLHLRANNPAAAWGLAVAAENTYQDLGDPLGVAVMRNGRLEALRFLGRLDEARELTSTCLADLDVWCDNDRALHPLLSLAEELWELGELAGLRVVLDRLARHADPEDDEDAEVLLLWDLRLRGSEGRPGAVLTEVDEVLARAREREDEDQVLEALQLRVQLRERAGDLGGALADQRELTELQAARLYARMGRRLGRALSSESHDRVVGLAEVDRRVEDRMGELDATYRRLEAEEQARREAHVREVELQRDLQRALRLESLGRLAGGVAHDFNNLLTVIRGNAEVLVDEDHDRADPGPVLEILGAAARGQRVVAQLLAFGRRQDLQLEELSPDHVVAAMDPLLVPLLCEDMDLDRQLEAPGARVRADRAKLESVIVNLLLNACEAMPEGGRARARTRVDGTDWVLTVADEGPGILPEHQELIFDPFFTTREEGEGGGMGLASALGIAKRLGGDLQLVESSPSGSTFELRLPLAQGATLSGRAASAEDGAAPAAPEALPAPEARLEGARILVVEDDAAIRRLVTAALERHGARASSAPDGRSGLERLVAGPPVDLVVCDVIMPGMGGPELFRHLVERDLAVPFLFTSGYPDRWNLEEFEGLGQVAFLPKPFDLETLARRVGELLI